MKPTILDALGLSAKPTKTPWRFAPTVKPKEMAATTGLATLYGLLFANLLFAPLLPHLAAQSNSPTNNAPTNSVHRDVFYSNPEFRDANSREDCDRILQEVLEKIKNTTDEIDKNWKAAERCDTRYAEELTDNDLAHRRAMAQAVKDARDLFWECMGFGATAAGGTTTVGWIVTKIKRATVTVTRFGVAAGAGVVVGIGVFIACKETREDTVQSLIDVANKTKEHDDKVSLTKRDECREDTNYARVKRRYDNWHRRRGGKRDDGGSRKAISRANADHAKCLALFPSGDCGVNE